MHNERKIEVGALARVEGEGGLFIRLQDGRVTDVELRIFEPPRFFEAFLRGRHYSEAPDITARICGICPVAYQMSAVHAMENAFGVTVDESIRNLRRLLYCGEWIESHALHVYMLHAPDFLGYESAVHMAQDHPQIVEQGLALKKAGNEILTLLGGRAIHPINVKVGGFYRVPAKPELLPLAETLKKARQLALETVTWVSKFPFPDFEYDYEFVALSHPHEYPLNEGRIVSSKGLDIAVTDYDDHFTEEHLPYSNALHSVIKHGDKKLGTSPLGAYLVGPMARYHLNYEKLSPLAKQAARDAGLGPSCRNPFQSIVVRSVETLYACDEALRIIDDYRIPEKPSAAVTVKAAAGYAATEAPRGFLYHRYRIGKSGEIETCKIVPPTSQNQKTIENDLREFVTRHFDLPEEKLSRQCEQAVRNYDPCISCATHFLKLNIAHE